MDPGEGRAKFLEQVKKGLPDREDAPRPKASSKYGVVRIDSACGPGDWAARSRGGARKRSPRPSKQAGAIAKDHGEKLAAEGEISLGRHALPGARRWTSERVGEPETVGFQADMAHTLLYTLGENAPEDRILPKGYDWKDPAVLDEVLLKTLTDALRPWTIDFHVAQNDATVFGSGSHDHTGRHCLANDPNGKLDIPHHAGFWLRDQNGVLTKKLKHICWDGCMFPNAVMQKPDTWNNILATMIAVRDAHGWQG